MRTRILLFTTLLLSFFSCEKEAEKIDAVELGCAFKSIEVSALAGEHEFSVICNTECTVSVEEGVSWLRLLSDSQFSGDAIVKVSYDENEGDDRQAIITLKAGWRTLELTLTQNNASTKNFFFPQRNILVDFNTGAHSNPFTFAVDVSTITYEVIYKGEQKNWIEEPVSGVIDGDFVFAVKENLTGKRRGAIITLSAPDAVGRIMKASLYVSQMANGEEETIPITVADVRALGIDDLDGENCIRKNYVLKARVLNDNSQGNGAANRNISIIMQDKTLSSRTLYLQSLEPNAGGQYCGIQLQFASADDNSTERYDILEINLKGMKFTSFENPFHVVLSGAGVVNIISCTPGTADDLPKIVRDINELKDEDIYTYVTIPALEIPIRKGPFCPVDLRYTNICNKYPMVVRDPSGSIMYMVSNTSCDWARDGKGLPEGSGPVSGIIVHEGCDNFEWNTEKALQNPLLADYITDVGYIGKYQIRPVTREEIAISSSLEDGLSKLIAEWRYANALYPDQIVQNVQNDTIYPTYPVALDPIKNPEVKGYMRYSGGKISFGQDWTHLGPVVDGKIADIPGGNGVVDALGRSIHWSPLSYLNICGLIQGQNGSSWHGGNWFSGDHNNPRLKDFYWEIAFSTEGLAGSNAPLSINLGVSSGYGDDTGAPRYWNFAWSTDKENWTVVTGSSYDGEDFIDDTAKGEDYTYTIPDFPLVASKKQYNLPGNKYVSINLPSSADIWGKELVFLRLYPAKDVSGFNGASGGVSYDGTTIFNNRRSCINYVGIRCKK